MQRTYLYSIRESDLLSYICKDNKLAKLLYRLGLVSAQRAWLVITSWILILIMSIAAMVGFSGKLSSSMSIDGVEAQRVIDNLQESFPEAARGQGQVVFYKATGEFTASEIDLISKSLRELEQIPGIARAIDPFETQSELDENRDLVLSGDSEIAKGLRELQDGENKISQAKQDIRAGEREISAGENELTEAELKIREGERELAKAQRELNQGKKELRANKRELQATLNQLNQAIAAAPILGTSEEELAQLVIAREQVQGGLSQIRAAEAEIATGQLAIDSGLAELEAGKLRLEQGRQDLAIGKQELERGKLDLVEAEAKIEQGYLDLETAKADLALGKRLLALTSEFGTISKDGKTAIATVQFDLPTNEVEDVTTKAVVAAMEKLRSDQIQVEFSQSLTVSFGDLLGVGEIVGLAIAAIVLFLMLGSMLAASLPVFSAVVGVGISASVTLALSGVIDMTTTTPILGVMLGLAVGIDYSLFILNRHRKQLKTGMEVRESIALATATSGNAVIFAGLTVIIALVALNLTGIGFLGLMGTMAALSIAVAVLIAVTLIPALMSIVGVRALNKKERAGVSSSKKDAQDSKNSLVPVFASKHPWLSAISVAILLAVVAIPAAQMRLGLPDGSSEPIDSTTYKSFQLVSENFGAGANGSLPTVVTMPTAVSESDHLELQADIGEKLFALPNVMTVLPAAVSKDNKTFLFQVIPKTGPATEETELLVSELRELAPQIKEQTGGELGVTGITPTNIDISDKLASVLPLYLSTVIALSLLLLILVFRSILVPLLATAGFLFTVLASFGAVVAVYQWGWLGFLFDVHDPGPILNFLPTILIGVLFGLAMDYQLFLASGIREAYVHGKSPKDAINYGIHLSRSVVIAAALIMVTVFGGFAFNHLTLVRPIGFGLAVGVLIDAFLVRLIFVPAVMTLLGKSAWWIPGWLDKLLPNVDVEGSSLEKDRSAGKVN
jgi:putative drug exporter of the RND superfamily